MTRLLLNWLLLTRLLLTGLHDSVPFIVAFVPNDGSDVLADSNLELLLPIKRTAAIISVVRLIKELLLLLMLIRLLIAGIVQVIPHSKATQLLNDTLAHRGGCTRVHQRLVQRSVVHRVVLHHGRLELLLILQELLGLTVAIDSHVMIFMLLLPLLKDLVLESLVLVLKSNLVLLLKAFLISHLAFFFLRGVQVAVVDLREVKAWHITSFR
jgi:hypothetical protein